MTETAYTVAVAFNDRRMADEWLEWVRTGHIAEVLAGGAASAEVIVLDGETPRFEVRYLFPSRQAFERYERDHAPRLRSEGLARFPLEKGVQYQRTLGSVAARFRRSQSE